MKRKLTALVALLLSLTLLTSCGMLGNGFSLLTRLLKGGGILVSYGDMDYQRPDYATIDQAIDDLTDLLTRDEGTRKTVLKHMTTIAQEYFYTAQTMYNLSFVAYAKNITDEAARDEYYYNEEETKRIGSRLEELFYLCAASKWRTLLEREIMGAGFFDDYDGGPTTFSPELTGLLEEESRLLKEYGAAMADLHVVYQGKTYTTDDIAAIKNETLYGQVVTAYYEKYSRAFGELYLQLVKVRRQIAEHFGYPDYATYAFEKLYAREYTPADAQGHLGRVKAHIAPLYAAGIDEELIEEVLGMPEASPDDVKEMAETVIKAMSKDLHGIYRDMLDHDLYVIDSSDTMYYGSFQLYFNDYYTPFLFVNGNGQISDVLTVIHEFGHFSSSYLNYGAVGSNDESEVASQGLELLSLRYLAPILGEEKADLLHQYEIYNMLCAINEGAAFTAFENAVYRQAALTYDELTALLVETMDGYGIGEETGIAWSWVFMNHLFEYPYYMLGYSVSADVAIQLYELGKADGMDTYRDLVELAYENDFFGNLDEVGLTSPLDAERVYRLRSFFERELASPTAAFWNAPLQK